jgi:hypothetical protein
VVVVTVVVVTVVVTPLVLLTGLHPTVLVVSEMCAGGVVGGLISH